VIVDAIIDTVDLRLERSSSRESPQVIFDPVDVWGLSRQRQSVILDTVEASSKESPQVIFDAVDLWASR
jgi:hypothetical protein